MAKVYDGISAKLASWIEAQPLFFVGTAPLADDGLVPPDSRPDCAPRRSTAHGACGV
jgi:hypothetical protein